MKLTLSMTLGPNNPLRNTSALSCNTEYDAILSTLPINCLLPIGAWSQNSECLSHPLSSRQKQRILFACSRRNKKSGIKWWPLRPAHNGITTWHESPYPIDPHYQVSPRLFLVISPSIEGPRCNIKNLSHSSLDGQPNEALTTSPPYLYLNASTCNSLFNKLLCRNIKIILIVNIERCHLPPLIATPCYKPYWHCLTPTCLIIQPIRLHSISPA